MSIPFLVPEPAAPSELTQEETWQARQRCQGNLCPWCILDARHGYLQEARARAAKLTSELPPGTPPEALRVLKHSVGWCEKICEQYPCEPPPPFSIFGPPAGSGTGSASSGASGIPSTQLACWRDPESVTASTHAPAARQAALATAGAAQQRPNTAAPFLQLDEWGVPVPGCLDANWVFECWSGPKYRWVAYTEPTQVQLQRAYNNREGVQTVDVKANQMQVSVAPGDMWQNNPDTGNNPRKLRISPKGGWPE